MTKKKDQVPENELEEKHWDWETEAAPPPPPPVPVSPARHVMKCPVKGHAGEIEIIHTSKRSYGICYCPGKNRFYGKIVWERS